MRTSKIIKPICYVAVGTVIGLFITFISLFPYPGGKPEQVWLNHAISYLREIRDICPKNLLLYDRLTYTIENYNKVGVFNVSFQNISSIGLVGYNDPYIPGIVVNERLLNTPIHYGAGIVLHEALHDWFPYYGHDHIDNIMYQYNLIVQVKEEIDAISKNKVGKKDTKKEKESR